MVLTLLQVWFVEKQMESRAYEVPRVIDDFAGIRVDIF